MSNTPAVITLRDILSRGHLRLVVLAVLVASIGMTVSGIFVIRGYANTNVELTARTIGYTVEPAVLLNDRDAIGRLIAKAGAVGDAEQIVVRGMDGETLAIWDHERGVISGEVAGPSSFLQPDSKDVAIEQEGKAIGTVAVQGSSAGIWRYALTGLIIGLCCLGLTLIATRILARRLEEDVVTPLDHVGDIAQAVQVDREFGCRVNISGIAEIDKLGRNFNALLSELQGWQKTLLNKNKSLAIQAERDMLTGLGNRARLSRTMDEMIARASATSDRFTLMFLDCNEFKDVNDRYGHEVGDMVLCGIAERLQRVMNGPDKVFRIGGDEFVILLDGISDAADIARVKGQIEDAMAVPFTLALRHMRILSMSIGEAVYPLSGTSPKSLLREADRRMYVEKRGGMLAAVNDS